jgi:hypothetical protein
MTDTSATASLTSAPGVQTAMTSSTSNTDAWKYRRRFMLWMTTFFMGMVLTALLAGKDAAVSEMAVMSGCAALTAIFGFYVAGAAWDDHSNRQFQLQGLIALKGGSQQGQDDGPH